ncbi:type II toxin-antitoxin system VapC family toxin [Candidatus Woesearchaeota archaeon]|nr:type II toxin-antitoxin system VapC family toxin [Candidatus Woesearchaeota archaeon]
MDTKVCLDTDVSIEILKNTTKASKLLDLTKDSEVYITTISIFELLLRETNLDAIEKLLLRTAILDFSELSARKAAEIFKDLKIKGQMIPLRDLLIASTAIANNCALATLNIKDFRNVKNLALLDFQ